MPYIIDYDQLVLEEGMAKGLEQGLVKMRAMILKNVERHFGSLPPDLAARLDGIADADALQRVFDLTWDASSAEDFMARLDQLGH